MRNQNGFTLLEVLVTLLIVSLGLLGIAGIIANSLKVNQGAFTRSQASWLATDIVDRMRANRGGAAAAYTLGSCAPIPAAGTTAQNDLNQWCGLVTAALPAGTGSVAFDAFNNVTVTLGWDDASRLAADAVVIGSGVFVMETRL